MKRAKNETKFKLEPYDYCDYRCKRCPYRSRCKVYQKITEQELKYLAEGKLPDDFETTLEDTRNKLEGIARIIYARIQESKINLDKLKEPGKKMLPPQEHSFLSYWANIFTKKTQQFLLRIEKLGKKRLQNIESDIEELSWYNSLVTIKIERAINSKWKFKKEIDQENRDLAWRDTQGSFKVALKSILVSLIALEIF